MSKTLLFQGIQFSINTHFISIWPIDRTLSGATTLGQSRPGSDGNKGVLCTPQSSCITGTSPSDCLVSYPGHLLTVGVLPPLQWGNRCILQPQPIEFWEYINLNPFCNMPSRQGCRILWLHLCRGVRPPPTKCPGYDTKQSDGEVPVMLELWGIWSTPSLPLLPGPFWPSMVAIDKAQSMD